MKKEEKKLKNDNFIDSFTNAFSGILQAIKTQKNIKIQIVIGILVIIAGFICKLEVSEFIWLTFTIFSVLFAEMINTAVEAAVDLCTQEYHPLAKIAKDVAAGAVLLMSINAVVIGCLIFLF